MPTRAKYEADLAKTDIDIDRVQGKVIRWVNKLADLRAKRKRLVKNIASSPVETTVPTKGRKPVKKVGTRDQRFSNLDI